MKIDADRSRLVVLVPTPLKRAFEDRARANKRSMAREMEIILEATFTHTPQTTETVNA